MNSLVIGGSSGLGLELARLLATHGQVIVTGRKDPKIDFAKFYSLELNGSGVADRIARFIDKLPEVDILVYSAGFYLGESLAELKNEQIEKMLDVGARGLIYAARDLLKKQGKLNELITITSSSQYTPRPLETVYNFVKSGEAIFSAALAQDKRVGKVLVAAPSGMQTAFWRDQPDKDTGDYLDPKWVAKQINKARQPGYSYKEIRILRGNPPKVEKVASR
jgi:NAD(P)-dependent dehydrogenase (short-subunit alcohol dehydrogenase family)